MLRLANVQLSSEDQMKSDPGHSEREILDRFHFMSAVLHNMFYMQDKENKFGRIH